MAAHTTTNDAGTGSFWTTGPGSYLLVLAIAGMGIYLLASKLQEPPDAPTATATIIQRLPALAASTDPRVAELLRLEGQNIRRRIISEQNVRAAAERVGLEPADADIERLCRNLLVVATEEPAAGQVKIVLSLDDQNSERAVRLVNDLAEHYVADHRTQLETTAAAGYDKAHAAAERGQLELTRARAEFDAFLGEHFQQYRKRTEELAVRRKPRAKPKVQSEPVGQSKKPVVENPAGAEVDRELGELLAYRERLLIDRTPEHPEVREVDTEIAGLRKQLASIPRETDLENSEELPPGPELAAEDRAAADNPVPAELVRDRRAQFERFNSLTAALDAARRNYDQLARAEREAWGQRVRDAGLDLQLAQWNESLGPKNGRWQTLLIALIGAIVVTGAVGLMSAGARRDPTFTTVQQVESTLHVPVVGLIPADGLRLHDGGSG